MFSICLARFPRPPVAVNPPWYRMALGVATIRAVAGWSPAARHLIWKNFSAPRSVAKPASVTTAVQFEVLISSANRTDLIEAVAVALRAFPSIAATINGDMALYSDAKAKLGSWLKGNETRLTLKK